MSVQLTEKCQNYTYTMGCGPLALKCSSSYTKDFQRLDRILECLSEPNIAPASFLGSVGRQAQGVRVLCVRLINFMRTGTWMNEEGARKLVKRYATLDSSYKRPEQTKQIQQVYDRLAQISRAEGTYADKIDRNSLEPQSKESPECAMPSPQRLFSLLVEDPRMQETMKMVGSLAVEVLALVVKSYGSEIAARTAAAALDPLRRSRAPVQSRVFTI